MSDMRSSPGWGTGARPTLDHLVPGGAQLQVPTTPSIGHKLQGSVTNPCGWGPNRMFSGAAEGDAELTELLLATIDRGEDPGAVRGEREGVLEVRGHASVGGDDGPVVVEDVGVLA